MDTVIPAVDPWDEVLRNPYIWHFAFHTIEGLPELLVEGHQREYFDFFFDVLSVDPTKIIPEVRREYAAAYGTVQSLSAGFDFYRAFARDAEDNIAFSSGPSVSTPCLYMRREGELGGIENYVRGLCNAGISNLFSAEVPRCRPIHARRATRCRMANRSRFRRWRRRHAVIDSGFQARFPTG
jgi:hypothetical protein